MSEKPAIPLPSVPVKPALKPVRTEPAAPKTVADPVNVTHWLARKTEKAQKNVRSLNK